MKTLRNYLAAIALVLAVGGAFATEHLALNTYYKFIDNPSPDEDECQPVEISQTCVVSGSTPCIVGSDQLRQHSDETLSCGLQLNFQ